MSAFKEMLEEEKKELDSKVEKLESFINSDRLLDVGPIQRSLLMVQLNVMQSYSQVLAERIDWLKEEFI